MQRFDESTAQCLIFIYKEGLLSPLGHDLRIEVASFKIDLGGEDHFIRACFDAASLSVDCAMVDGVARPGLLSPSDKADIKKRMMHDILDTRAFPEITFVSSSLEKKDSSYQVSGVMTLRDTSRTISFIVRRESGNLTADCSLHLPDFGIKPFAALFGAIRIKPDILIRLTMPVDKIEGNLSAL